MNKGVWACVNSHMRANTSNPKNQGSIAKEKVVEQGIEKKCRLLKMGLRGRRKRIPNKGKNLSKVRKSLACLDY